ncbi:glutathione S-transferase [Annulohypoxylon truncatum]|uniref:glutathione S-transferase n=1 Tax=Annulohypoxylon truncatum TaxID=327061 RepID=UPI0020084A22|nr:glutathione S-transferase [Annulohypoxylon truncatum]KAI1211300.1 glutathione S-transferase [Annulohypoxylon truncatum]
MSASALRGLLPRSIRIPSARLSSACSYSVYLRQYNHTTTLHRKATFSTSRTATPPPPTSSQEQQDSDMSEPTGLIAKSGIELLTFGTPNGHKVSILLEELKAAYGKEYTWQSVNIMKNTQKEPWFTAINPNGRIPAIVDHDRNDFAVFEGLPILTYLTRHYDPEYKFSFPVDSDDYSIAEQWMAWQHGGVGPMQGQANHFLRFAKEKIPYAAQRYVGESERLYGILDKRLEGRDYIVGPGRGKYSIADMNLFGWANIALLSGVELDRFPNIKKWLDRIHERPAVKKGLAVPQETAFSNAALLKSLESNPETKAQQEELNKFLNEAKEKYGYKYTSP